MKLCLPKAIIIWASEICRNIQWKYLFWLYLVDFARIYLKKSGFGYLFLLVATSTRHKKLFFYRSLVSVFSQQEKVKYTFLFSGRSLWFVTTNTWPWYSTWNNNSYSGHILWMHGRSKIYSKRFKWHVNYLYVFNLCFITFFFNF